MLGSAQLAANNPNRLACIALLAPLLAHANCAEHEISGPAKVEFQGLPIDTDVRRFLHGFEATSRVQASPIFGGIESLALPRMAYAYNSAPFGNCGTLNTMCAARYSFLTGFPFRYRATTWHVATEMHVDGDYFVFDGYTGDALVDDKPPYLYSLNQLETDAAIWSDDRLHIKKLFEKVYPLDGQAGEARMDAWPMPMLELKAGESLRIDAPPIDSLDLIESPGLDMRSLDDPGDYSINFGHFPLRRLDWSRGIESDSYVIAPPFFVTSIALRPLAWPEAYGEVYKIARALSVRPIAPEWAVDAMATSHGGGKWQVSNGEMRKIGCECILLPSDDAPEGTFRLSLGIVNGSDRQRFAWLPLKYRTPTPSRQGDGRPVAGISAQNTPQASINIYARTESTYYGDLIFPVEPQQDLVVVFTVPKGKILEFQDFTSNLDIVDVISPLSPAMAVEAVLDRALISEPEKTVLSVQMLANPFLDVRINR